MDDVYKLGVLSICQNWLVTLVILETKCTNSKTGCMLVLRVPSNLTHTIFRMLQFEACLEQSLENGTSHFQTDWQGLSVLTNGLTGDWLIKISNTRIVW